MQIEGTNPEDGTTFTAEAPGLTSSILSAIADLDFSDERIREIIDQLDVSADTKSALYSVSRVTVRVGQTIVKIGRKIIDTIIALFEEFPNAGFGAIFGAIIGFLISAIPIIGQIFGPLVTPVLISYGLAVGAKDDIRNKDLARKIAMANQQFSSFGTE
ncbi:hypothetical protein ACFL3W_00930 [Pseudomonadota bacterium]